MYRTLHLIIIVLTVAGCTVQTTPIPTPSPVATTPTPAGPNWIEVVLAEQTVYLWQGDQMLASLPISSGVGDSPSTTTYTGEFKIATMYPGPEQTAPGVFVRDILIFDWEHGNGFHSLPMDANGTILDPTIGKPASAGCVRVAESGVLYNFAELGMRVVIR